MLSLFLTGVLSFLSWLPDSFVQTFVAGNIYGYAKLVPLLGYINYFFPVYILETMVAIWVPIMLAIFIYFKVSNIFD